MEIFTGEDTGQVKVGNTILPGIFESLEITGTVKIDQVDIPGKQEKITQAVGYDNARLRLTVNLYPVEDGAGCEDQIAVYQRIFRKSADQEKPGVYKIINRHTAARNINEIIVSDLKTWEDNRNEKVLVICEFIEHVPIQIKTKEKAARAQASAAPSPAPAARPGMGDLRKLEAEPKTNATPAKDDRQPSLGRRVLNWIKGVDNE